MTITYRPKGVCSRLMRVEVENGLIRKVEVPVQQAIERMEGVRCGSKLTSCPDQLAKALRQAL